MSKPFVASYSRIKMERDCPLKFYHLEIAKDVEQPPYTKDSSDGVKAHARLERCVEDGLDMPFSLKKYQWVLDHVRKNIRYAGPGTYEKPITSIGTELKFGLNKRLDSCSFFDKDVKFRGVADLALLNGIIGHVYDYKNGNPKYADTGQLDYMALCMFVAYPQLKNVYGQLLFLNNPEEVFHTESYESGDLPFLKKQLVLWFKKIQRRKAENNWPAQQSGLCKKHCPVPHSKCKYSGKAG